MTAANSAPVSLVDALQDALAGEHAARYAYAVIGGVVDPTGPTETLALAAYGAHSARRDRLDERLRELGESPAAAEPGYALPETVRAAGDAQQLARQVEDRCAVLYAAVVAASTGPLRRRAADWLEDAAVRTLDWGAASTAFPGVTLA